MIKISGIPSLDINTSERMDYLQQRFRNICQRKGYLPVYPPSIAPRYLFEDLFRNSDDYRVFALSGHRESLILVPEQTRILLEQYRSDLSIPRIWRNYSIQKAWRDDRAQRGRFKEFVQFNLEIIRPSITILDILSVLSTALEFFEEYEFILEISCSRTIERILRERILRETTPELLRRLLVSFDSDMSITDILREFPEIENTSLFNSIFRDRDCDIFFRTISEIDPNSEILDLFRGLFESNPRIRFNPRLSRGITYYQGIIFEGILDIEGSKSVMGGGEYNINNITGVGFGIGATRLLNYDTGLDRQPLNLNPLFIYGDSYNITRHYPIISRILERTNCYPLRTRVLKTQGIEINVENETIYYNEVEYPFERIEEFLINLTPQPEFESGTQP